MNEYEKLREEILGYRRKKETEKIAFNRSEKIGLFDDLLSPLERKRQKYLRRKKTTRKREKDTLDKLASFRSKIMTKHAEKKQKNEEKMKENVKEFSKNSNDSNQKDAYHKQQNKLDITANDITEDDVERDLNDGNWITHQIRFIHRPQDFDPMARNVDLYEYEVLDPRAKRLKEKWDREHKHQWQRV